MDNGWQWYLQFGQWFRSDYIPGEFVNDKATGPGVRVSNNPAWSGSFLYPIGSMVLVYILTLGVYWWSMLPYMAYMDPMGTERHQEFWPTFGMALSDARIPSTWNTQNSTNSCVRKKHVSCATTLDIIVLRVLNGNCSDQKMFELLFATGSC